MPGQRDPHPEDFHEAILASTAVHYPDQFKPPAQPTLQNKKAFGNSIVAKPQTGGPGTLGNGGSWQTIVLTPNYDEARDWSIIIQPGWIPAGANYIWVQISYSIGEVTFKKKPILLNKGYVSLQHPELQAPEFRYFVSGSRVQVDVIFQSSTGGLAPLPIAASAAQTNTACPDDFYQPQWYSVPANGSYGSYPIDSIGTGYSGGVLMAYQVLLTAMSGDATLYLGFYDSNDGNIPSGGSYSIWDTPCFTTAPSYYAFKDGPDYHLWYSRYLVAAWSSTPGYFTQSTGSPIAAVQVKYGS